MACFNASTVSIVLYSRFVDSKSADTAVSLLETFSGLLEGIILSLHPLVVLVLIILIAFFRFATIVQTSVPELIWFNSSSTSSLSLSLKSTVLLLISFLSRISIALSKEFIIVLSSFFDLASFPTASADVDSSSIYIFFSFEEYISQ